MPTVSARVRLAAGYGRRTTVQSHSIHPSLACRECRRDDIPVHPSGPNAAGSPIARQPGSIDRASTTTGGLAGASNSFGRDPGARSPAPAPRSSVRVPSLRIDGDLDAGDLHLAAARADQDRRAGIALGAPAGVQQQPAGVDLVAATRNRGPRSWRRRGPADSRPGRPWCRSATASRRSRNGSISAGRLSVTVSTAQSASEVWS